MQFGSAAGVATVRVVWDSFGTDKGPPSRTRENVVRSGFNNRRRGKRIRKEGFSRGVPRGLFRDLLYPFQKKTFFFFSFFYFIFVFPKIKNN